MVTLPDLRQDALPIQPHQFFRIVLLRKHKLFIYFDDQILPRKKLLLDLLFHGIDLFLLDQPLTSDIDAQQIPAPGGSDPLHHYLLEQVLLYTVQLQIRKCLKKPLFHHTPPGICPPTSAS